MADRSTLKTLVAEMSRGDQAALRRLYDDRADVLHALAFRILKDRARAAEALKVTFARIWRLARSGKAAWEMPDLEMTRICRETSANLAHQTLHGPAEDPEFAMSDPVKSGNATFELLALLQALGSMSAESRNAISLAFFDCPTREQMAARLSLAPDDLTMCLRRCYAEYVETSNAGPIGIDRETDLIAMIQALGLAPHPGGAPDDPLRHVWELRFAPLAELLEPVPVPPGTFEDIQSRLKSGAAPAAARPSGRGPEIRRAVTIVAVAAVIAVLIYAGLVAIDDGPEPRPATTVQENNG